LIGKPEGNRLLGKRRCRWEDNIKTDLKEIGCKGLDWIHLTQVRTQVYGNKSSGSITCEEFFD
jgi:hypothetical protein